jgi:serine/threonine protein kinase
MDRYKQIRKIGRGSFGDVWLVSRISDNEVKLQYFIK